MLGTHFENTLIRKYVAVFGTLFNNISISRVDSNGTQQQFFKVPLQYGPTEKALAMLKAKPDEKKRAIQLPRMSFEITGMSLDPTRALARPNTINGHQKMIYKGSPWNINFRVSIIVKSDLDATKIVEQILWYFRPEYTVDVKLLEGVDHIDRISVVYNTIQHQHLYEDNFETRRAIVWELDFTLKGWLYGPINDAKPIKFIDVSTFGSLSEEGFRERFTIQPGLTANGEPTTDINETIDYELIEKEDNWDFITLHYEGFVEE